MKKILMILTMALAATSCMDILDVAPEDQIASENMWTTEELADKGMAGLYFPFYATQLSSTQLRRADGLNRQHPYTDQRYNIELLAKSLNKQEHDISAAIKSQGFTGFREYINYLRLEYFRQLAAENPKSNVKELMFACGFTSRATFYRNFSEKYGVSPSKFIENQRVEQ